MLEQFEYEITRAGEDQSQEVGGRICSGRSQGSRQEEADSCDLRADLQEACRGSQREDLLGIHTVDVPVEEGGDGSCQERAGSCQEEGSHQGSQWLVGILRIIS